MILLGLRLKLKTEPIFYVKIGIIEIPLLVFGFVLNEITSPKLLGE